MLVPTELLTSVVFIGEQTQQGGRLAGTAFFVNVPCEAQPDSQHTYLVTAEHCVSDRRNLIIRMNYGDGTRTLALPPGDEWCRHPNPGEGEDTVDIAVLPWRADSGSKDAGYRSIPRSMYFDDTTLSPSGLTQGVGVGADVVAVGLLTVHYGKARNEPLVRTGTLALVPSEPVFVKDRRKFMRLYLTELRSIGGLSGSPVFASYRIPPSQVQLSFLGILIGHWDEGNNNMGIGMVAPASKLAEILEGDELRRQREEEDAMPNADEPKPTMDDAEYSEFERFESLTRKVVAVPKSEIDEEREKS